MSRMPTLKVVLLSCGLASIASPGRAQAQQAAPPGTKDIAITPMVSVDLGPEIEGMAGRQLRMRKITIKPGGFFDVHSHKDRPGTVYVLEGKVSETRNGVTKEYGPGQAWSEDKETNHRLDNKGAAPATFIAVDVFKQQ